MRLISLNQRDLVKKHSVIKINGTLLTGYAQMVVYAQVEFNCAPSSTSRTIAPTQTEKQKQTVLTLAMRLENSSVSQSVKHSCNAKKSLYNADFGALAQSFCQTIYFIFSLLFLFIFAHSLSLFFHKNYFIIGFYLPLM